MNQDKAMEYLNLGNQIMLLWPAYENYLLVEFGGDKADKAVREACFEIHSFVEWLQDDSKVKL